MYRIVKKRVLNPTVTLMEIEAPTVARKCEPGQFIILRVDENGERIPLTIAAYDREAGTVTIIFQIVGATTEKLNHKEQGECIQDFVGPLGKATETEGLHRVAVIGGGVGTAIAYPVAKKLHDDGCHVDLIVGFRNKDLIILKEEFEAASTNLIIGTDDGSYGKKALVTDLLKEQIDSGAKYDKVIAIGPVIMMKFVCAQRPQGEHHAKLRFSAKLIMYLRVRQQGHSLPTQSLPALLELTIGLRVRFQRLHGLRRDGRAHLGNQINPVLLGESRAQSGQMRQSVGRGTVPAQLVAQVLRNHFYAFTKVPFALQQLPEPAVYVISRRTQFFPNGCIQTNHSKFLLFSLCS